MNRTNKIKFSKDHIKMILRPLIFVFGFIIALGIIANILVDNPYAHRIIRVAINEKVHQFTNLRIDFKAVNVKVLPMELSLYGFNLFVENDEGKTETIASASQIHTSVSLFSLFLGMPKLKNIEITDLKFQYPYVSKIEFYGEEKQADAGEELQWPPDMTLPLYGIEIRNASFGYLQHDDEGNELIKLSLEGFDFDAEIDDWQDIVGGISVSALAMKYDGSDIFGRSNLQTDFIVDKDDVHFEAFNFKGDVLEVAGRLEANLIKENGSIKDLTVNGYTDFAGDLLILDRILDIPDTAGFAKGKAQLTAGLDIDNPDDFRFELALSGGVEKGKIYEYQLMDSQADLTIDKDGLKFTNIEIIKEQKSLGRASGTLAFDDEVNFDFKYSPTDLPLTTLLDSILVDFSFVEANLDAKNYRIKGKGFPFRLDIDGDIVVSKIDLPELDDWDLDLEKSPSCLIRLKMGIDTKGLDVDGTKGYCVKDSPQALTKANGKTKDLEAYNHLESKGRIDFNDSSKTKINVISEDIDLRLFNYFSKLQLTGRGGAQIGFFQERDQFVINGDLDLQAVQVQAVPLGDLKSSFKVIDDLLEIDQFTSKINAVSTLQLSQVQIELDEGLAFSGKLVGSGLQKDFSSAFISALQPNEKDINLDIEFVTADLKGNLLKPFLYTGRLNALVKNASWKEQKVFDSLRFDITANNKKDMLKYFSYQVGGFVLNASGTRTRKYSKKLSKNSDSQNGLSKYGLDLRDPVILKLGTTHKVIDLDKKNEDRSNLQDLPIVGEAVKSLGINGRLSVNAKLQGDFSKLAGSVQTTLSKAKLFGGATAPFTLEAFVDGSKIDTIVRHSGNALTGRFSVDIGKERYPYQMYIKASRFDMRAFTPINFHNDARNYAYLTASLKLDGELEQWWDSMGNLDISDLKVNVTTDFTGETKEIKLSQQEPVSVAIDKNGWIIEDNKKFELAGNFLTFTLGTGKNNPPDSIDISFDGELDLSGAALLTTQIESSSGTVVFTGEVKGSVQDPQYQVKIFNEKSDSNNVNIGIADLRPPFENIDFDVSINNKRLVLESLSARKGGGSVSALGNFNFESQNREDSQIDVTFNEASIIIPSPVVKLVEGAISGNLFIRNFGPPFDVRGNIRVDRGRTIGEVDPRKEVIEALRRSEFTNLAANNEPTLLLNINVNADNSIIINNRNMQATLSSNLKISGTDVQPLINGQVEINKGKFVYKRDFNLTQGILTFDDPVKLDPKLDINAIAEVQNHRVFISITGRASEPVVDLSTDPATRDDGTAITKLDIITLLSTGTLPDISRNEINSQTVARTEALNIFAGQLEEPVEKLFDLAGQNVVREVYIDTYSTNEGRPLARLNMPLNLGKNWDMIFRVDQESWKLSSEYSLHDNISVLGSFDGRSEVDINDSSQSAAGDTGVDVKFRFAFP